MTRDAAIERCRRVLEDVGLVPVTPLALVALGELYDTAWAARGRADAATVTELRREIAEGEVVGVGGDKCGRVRG